MRGTGAVALLFVVVLAGCLGGLVASDASPPTANGSVENETPATNGTIASNADGTLAANTSANGSTTGGPPSAGALSFSPAAEEAGLTYRTSDSGVGNGNDGVYVADYDGDLDSDVLAIGGEEPVLFRNTGGEFERSDALPEISGTVQGALFFDHDVDGTQDLLILRRGATPVFLDNQEGEFVRTEVGLNDTFSVPVGASAADYTGDGCPDLFVAQYGNWSNTTPTGWQVPTSLIEQDNGNPNALYRGTCGGFERAANDTIRGTHWSLATSFTDLDADGRPDIHVANDYYNDTIYYNQGNGTFEKVVLGAKTDRNGMSSEVADLDGDGRRDVFVTNIYFPENTSALTEDERQLFEDFVENRLGKRMRGNNLLLGANDTGAVLPGNGTTPVNGTGGGVGADSDSTDADAGPDETSVNPNAANADPNETSDAGAVADAGFAYAAERFGLRRGGWGWGAAITDFDNNGEQDVFHGTQTVITFNDSAPRYPTPMTWLQANGSFHRQVATEIGFGVTNDRAVAHVDFDLSGTPDLAVATYDDRHRLYRNNVSVANDAAAGNSLQVRVKSGDLNHTSLGARVLATTEGDTQLRVNNAKSDYQSQGTRFLHFGLGDTETVSELRVVWPDGTESVFENVSAGQRIVVTPEGIAANASYRDESG